MRVKITPCEKRRRAPGRENRVNSPLNQLTVGRFSFFCYAVVHDIWYPSLSGRGCDRVSVCWGWKKRFIWSLHPCNDEVLRTPQEDAHAQCKSDALAATKGRGAERRLINIFFGGGGFRIMWRIPGGVIVGILGGGVQLVFQILTLFQTKKCHFPHPFSDLAFRSKLCHAVITYG